MGTSARAGQAFLIWWSSREVEVTHDLPDLAIDASSCPADQGTHRLNVTTLLGSHHIHMHISTLLPWFRPTRTLTFLP